MDDPALVTSDDRRLSGPVFVSYATADRKRALAACEAIERRGPRCWMSARDVAPGENYQEAIVRSLRDARAVVLIFSAAANNSDEIKKELSLASRFRVPVIALRVEDVEPTDAFAYELSTRQWIDAFEGWDASIDLLVGRIAQLSGAAAPLIRPPRRPLLSSPRWMAVAAAAALVLVLAGGAWWWLRPASTPAHSMTVRLGGFRLLSAGLPATFGDTVGAEIAAAFNADGVVGVSTAAGPPAGSAPAYVLDGTIQRDGGSIRVITRLTNERSGTGLWSETFDYDGKELSKVPRHIAVDAGNVVRCGLFGASTYYKPLPDPVFRDYMQFCQGHWDPDMLDGRNALIPAQRVVAALPDFSWGWAAVAGGYWKVAATAENDRLAEEARANGREAADRAVAIDGKNSEALYIKAMLVPRHDWIARETLFKRAVAARRLDCGCEHHQYGIMLEDVGRVAEAVEQLRQADNMLALYVYTPLTLADALVTAGRSEEAKRYFDAAIGLAPDSGFAQDIAVSKATASADVDALLDPKLDISSALRAALVKGYRARASANPAAKADAAKAVLALPQADQSSAVARLLADLGADHEALEVAARLAARAYPGPSLFWYPGMRRALNDPGFPAVVQQLGLVGYWKASHSRPDVCQAKDQPAFCRMIDAR